MRLREIILYPSLLVNAIRMSARGKFTTGQTWGALKKAWKGYKIAKVQSDKPRMTEYAKKIKTLQGELGIRQSTFPEVGV
jgi:hypothetical protein